MMTILELQDLPKYPLEKKPPWLRAKIPGGPGYNSVKNLVDDNALHTVCESAQCPNLGECWSRRTATVMILGNTCTRHCGFCAVDTGRPTETDWAEPARVAQAVKTMGLRYAVITSVARDDLEDEGSSIWANTIRAIRHESPETTVEVLIPDFKDKEWCLNRVLQAKPDILNHNIETVPRLQKKVRSVARYEWSTRLLDRAKHKGFTTKTGMMLGIGERQDEIDQTLQELAEIKVDILTLGQYLRPTKKHLPIDRWVTPEEFAHWKQRGLELGFGVVESGPLIRSSYHADEQGAKYARNEQAIAA
ncbi:MAG: lipoyl synthase [Verrucomicrobiota bacterium]